MRIGILALGVLLVLGGCGSAGDRSPAGPEVSPGWTTAGCEFARHTLHPDLSRLRGAVADIEKAGTTTYRDTYAGIEIDEAKAHAIVYRKPSGAFDDWLRTSAGDHLCLIVRDSPHTAAELGGWHDRVLADLAYWTAQGIHVDTIGARHDGAGVEIGTPDGARAQRQMMARYGAQAPLIFLASTPVHTL